MKHIQLPVAHDLNPQTIIALEAGDGVAIGWAGAGLYGQSEDSTLITFTTYPDHDNDVEILIPKRVWDSFVEKLSKGAGNGTWVVPSLEAGQTTLSVVE